MFTSENMIIAQQTGSRVGTQPPCRALNTGIPDHRKIFAPQKGNTAVRRSSKSKVSFALFSDVDELPQLSPLPILETFTVFDVRTLGRCKYAFYLNGIIRTRPTRYVNFFRLRKVCIRRVSAGRGGVTLLTRNVTGLAES